MRTRHWPLFDLVVRTPRLELRCPDDELALALAVLAARGIHDPNWMPFNIPWTDVPPGELERVRCSLLAQPRPWTAEDWHCSMAVWSTVKSSDCRRMSTKQFRLTHEFETGSWLGRAPGQGHRQGDARRDPSSRFRRPWRTAGAHERLPRQSTIAARDRGTRVRAERRQHRTATRRSRPSVEVPDDARALGSTSPRRHRDRRTRALPRDVRRRPRSRRRRLPRRLGRRPRRATTLLDVRVVPTFADVLALRPPARSPSTCRSAFRTQDRVRATSMPAGGLDRDAHRCSPRRSARCSRPTTYQDALAIGGLSKQAYNLLPKIREVDALMTPAPAAHDRRGAPRAVLRPLARANRARARSARQQAGPSVSVPELDRLPYRSASVRRGLGRRARRLRAGGDRPPAGQRRRRAPRRRITRREGVALRDRAVKTRDHATSDRNRRHVPVHGDALRRTCTWPAS